MNCLEHFFSFPSHFCIFGSGSSSPLYTKCRYPEDSGSMECKGTGRPLIPQRDSNEQILRVALQKQMELLDEFILRQHILKSIFIICIFPQTFWRPLLHVRHDRKKEKKKWSLYLLWLHSNWQGGRRSEGTEVHKELPWIRLWMGLLQYKLW